MHTLKEQTQLRVRPLSVYILHKSDFLRWEYHTFLWVQNSSADAAPSTGINYSEQSPMRHQGGHGVC